jgi:hypothetical protein
MDPSVDAGPSPSRQYDGDRAASAVANLFRCPRVRDAADLIIGYSRQREMETAQIYAEAQRRRVNVSLLPLLSPVDSTIPARLASLITTCSAMPTAVMMVEGDRFPAPIWDVLRDRTSLILLTGCRTGHSPWEYLAEPDFGTPFDTLLGRLRAADEVIVRNRAMGLELTVRVDPDTGWRTDLDEDLAAPLLFPYGQVSSQVLSATGSFAANAAFSLNRLTRMDVRLAESPVVVDIVNGRVTGYRTHHPYVGNLLARAALRHNLARVTALTDKPNEPRCAAHNRRGRLVVQPKLRQASFGAYSPVRRK